MTAAGYAAQLRKAMGGLHISGLNGCFACWSFTLAPYPRGVVGRNNTHAAFIFDTVPLMLLIPPSFLTAAIFSERIGAEMSDWSGADAGNMQGSTVEA